MKNSQKILKIILSSTIAYLTRKANLENLKANLQNIQVLRSPHGDIYYIFLFYSGSITVTVIALPANFFFHAVLEFKHRAHTKLYP